MSYDNVASYLDKQSGMVSKLDWTPEIKKLVEFANKHFDFVNKVYKRSKGFAVQGGFDGTITSKIMRELLKHPKFDKIDIDGNKVELLFI